MKIAIFSDNFYPELSGITDSIITTVGNLAKMGHQIRIYAPKYSATNYRQSNLPHWEIELGENISIYRFSSWPFPSGTKQSRFVIPTGIFCIRDLKKFKPDIIHSHQAMSVGIEALAGAKFLKIPLVGTNHTAITEFLPIRNKWLDNLALQYVNWYYSRCNIISAPSRSVITEMEKLGFKTKSEIISNPIDDAYNTFIDGTDNEKVNLKNKFGINNKTLVYVGRFAPEKNIEIIIKAVALVKNKIPDINLAMAGHGSSLDSIKKLVSELGLEKNVKFVGTLNRFELADLYRASEIFAITSKSETQSMTLIQAMACGLPVIGVRARALPEYINEKNGIIIEPDDYSALSENIIDLLNNPEKMQRLGIGGVEFVQKFSAESIANKWNDFYKKALNKKQ